MNACILLLSSFILYTPVHAAPARKSPDKELSEIQKKLKEKKQLIQRTIEQERSILSELENINKGIKQKQDELKNYEARIAQTLTKIKSTEDEIVEINARLGQKKQVLRERLRIIYKEQYSGKALILISAVDYQDLIKRSRNMSLLSYQDRRAMDSYTAELENANSKKAELEDMQKSLESSRNSVREKQIEMQSELSKKDTLLASVRSKRSSYEKMIKELEQASEKLREMIEALEKEKPSAAPPGKGFARLKGRLSWPVEGDIVIPFGKYRDPQYNIPVFKNGIEIKPRNGAEPAAVENGNVVFADWFKGYGQLLIINHGDGYHSLYGHLSEIFHNSGDIIKKGDIVGKIGESGILNVPTLYFEIRHKGKPVDPAQWLKRNNSRRY